jgi:diguanylate cyclase (GGDEF)-like protein
MNINIFLFPLLSIILVILLFQDYDWSSIVGLLIICFLNFLYFKNIKREGLNLISEDLIYDPVTNLFSSNYFRYHLMEDFQRAKRTKTNLSLLIFDIDHFKEININLGFRFGDLVLKEVAQLANNCIRTSDVLSYLGGDEFGVILYNSDKETAKMIGERIIKKLTSSPLIISIDERRESIHFTISMGGSTLSDNMDSPLELIDKARLNLEKAKRRGGNEFIFD